MGRPHPLLVEIAAGRRPDLTDLDEDVVDSAEEHRMLGLLLAEVRHSDAEIDSSIRTRLEALDMQWAVQRRRLETVAADVHAALESAGIRHLFFKGVVESHRLFDDPGQRPFADIDVCIAPGESLSRAVAAIAPDFPDLESLDALVSEGFTSTVGFYEQGGPLDVHTDFVRIGKRARRPDLWWSATTTMELSGVGTVEVLDPDAAFAILVLHQARDRFRYLIGHAEFVRRLEAGVDFSRVKELAEAEGLWDQLAVAVEVMSSEMGRDAPVEPPPSWRGRLWRRLWKEEIRLLGPEGRSHNPRLGSWLMPLLARGRTWETFRWIGRSVFPPDVRLRRLHPEARGPYLWRVVSTRIAHRWRRMAARRRSGAGRADHLR